MQFTEAFKTLGYEVVIPRQDWSAERRDGVCMTLWTKEIDWKTLTVDTRVHAGPNEDWRLKPGNTKRIAHLTRALAEFDGRVDVVTVHGEPGHGFGDASPWKADERKGFVWRVLSIDPVTGHSTARAELQT